MLRSAILIYLTCRERGNEGITHRPKDESEFVAKKMTFEANIFKFFLKGEPTVPIRRNLTADANTNGYRTDTEQVRECERMVTERIQNGYRTDIERIRNGNKGKSVLYKRTRSSEHMLVSYAIRVPTRDLKKYNFKYTLVQVLSGPAILRK